MTTETQGRITDRVIYSVFNGFEHQVFVGGKDLASARRTLSGAYVVTDRNGFRVGRFETMAEVIVAVDLWTA